MLVVLANQSDDVARQLTSRWTAAGQDVGLLTPRDLSRCGWRHHLGQKQLGRAVIEGRVVKACEIDGVLTRMPSVFPHELSEIVPEDRGYVAAEMTAFLLSWLSELDCPVINGPTPTCLAGPYWRPERWVLAARELGVPVKCLRRHIGLGPRTGPEPQAVETVNVNVVGANSFGNAAVELTRQAWRLAEAAGCDLLAVKFDGQELDACFVEAHPWPDLAAPELADAALEHLLARRRAAAARSGAA